MYLHSVSFSSQGGGYVQAFQGPEVRLGSVPIFSHSVSSLLCDTYHSLASSGYIVTDVHTGLAVSALIKKGHSRGLINLPLSQNNDYHRLVFISFHIIFLLRLSRQTSFYFLKFLAQLSFRVRSLFGSSCSGKVLLLHIWTEPFSIYVMMYCL